MELQIIQNESALALITKAEIDMQISTAKAFPRSIKNFLDSALSMATINESIADSCGYALSRGGKSIQGPSVRLAEIVCSAYGNVRTGARVIANDGKVITAQGVCHDLEKNNCVTVEVRRSILQNEWIGGNKTGKMIPMSEDMQVIIGNAACSIAFRNAVYKVIPAALVDDIYQKTKQVANGTEETLPKKRKKAIDYLIGKGIKEGQICEAIGVKRIEDIDLEKLSILRGMVSAINNGEFTIKEMFEKTVNEPSKEEQKASKEFERAMFLLEDCATEDELYKFATQIDIKGFTTEQLEKWTSANAAKLSSLKK